MLVRRAVHLQPLVAACTCRRRSSCARAARRSRRRRRAASRGPAARSRAQHLRDRHPELLGEVEDLDGGEGLEVDAGLDALQAREQLGVVVERQPGVQAVDDVDLGDRVAGVDARAQLRPRLLVRHRVGARVALLEARERAEHAARLADVGGVDVQVAVEVGAVAVQPLAHLVGQRADLEQVGVLGSSATPSSSDSGSPRAHLVADRGERARRCITGVPPRACRRRAARTATRPAPRISVAASLRVSAGLLALAPRRSARSATMGANSSSAPKPNAICARRGPSAVDVGQHVRDARQRQPAEREEAQRVEAVRLAHRRRHDAPDVEAARSSARQPVERARPSLSPLRNGSAPRGARLPAAAAAALRRRAGRPAVDARRARRAEPPSAARSASSTNDSAASRGPRQAPVASSWRARTKVPRRPSARRAPPRRGGRARTDPARPATRRRRRRRGSTASRLDAHRVLLSPRRPSGASACWAARAGRARGRPRCRAAPRSSSGFE